jgi:eukaryotic-like serine/threonine-protein kinase
MEVRSWPGLLGALLIVTGLGACGENQVLKPKPPAPPAPKYVTVPEVAGETVQSACRKVTSMGLGCGADKFEPSPSVPEGLVIETRPPAGRIVIAGSTVSVVVSQTGASVLIPDVVGDTPAEADSALGSVTVTSVRTCQPTSIPVRDGVVVSQSPRGGTAAPEHSRVILAIGRPSCP